ncbi:hypothetical protein D9M73_291190 [compost metagenome]
MIRPVFEYRLKSSISPACLSSRVIAPLKPRMMMKAKASGTPAKLLVMLAKAMTKSRRRLSTWRRE